MGGPRYMEAGMIEILVAKLLSPSVVIFAGVGGALSREWWHAMLAAGVAATAHETFLFSIQYTRQFNPIIFALGFAAACAWAFAAYWIAQKVRLSRSK